MCFERLLQAFARWQPDILFDTGAQLILEYRWIVSCSQPSLQTQFKVATVYSIHTQSQSWCSIGLVPNVLPRRDEGSGKPCAVDQASLNIGTHSGLEPETFGSTVQSSNHYTNAGHVWFVQPVGHGWFVQPVGHVWFVQPVGHVWFVQPVGHVWFVQPVGHVWFVQPVRHVWFVQPVGQVWSDWIVRVNVRLHELSAEVLNELVGSNNSSWNAVLHILKTWKNCIIWFHSRNQICSGYWFNRSQWRRQLKRSGGPNNVRAMISSCKSQCTHMVHLTPISTK